jgi:carbamate kinase
MDNSRKTVKKRKGKPVLLVALGGNALIREGQIGTIEEQFQNLKTPIRQIARLARKYSLIITHGNGPQVGNLLLQQECCPAALPSPLEILVAQTQGELGYMIESTLDSALMESHSGGQNYLVSLLSYVVVDENDPSFREPSKPIGPVYPEERVPALPFPVTRTRGGYRRVVASPEPVTIVEKEEIKKLIEMNFIVICCGGGGIPVIREGRTFSGVNAVIDKDLASAVLALEVGVDIFMIATDVEGAALHYGKPGERFLRTVTVEEAVRYHEEGHFPPGSMGPKIEAAVKFIKGGGDRALITSIENIGTALEGLAGTEILP